MKRVETCWFHVPGGSSRIEGHRHTNPDGSLGGWVANDAVVPWTAYIDKDAVVWPGARVPENARITCFMLSNDRPAANTVFNYY